MEGNSASTSEAQAIGETGGEPATGAVKQNTTPIFSQSNTHSRAVWLMYLAGKSSNGEESCYNSAPV